MVGNDIIDIAETKRTTNYQRPRFLDKLFSESEQEFIIKSEDSFISVWRLWSMKEAAYKLYTQLYPSRFYNPKGFQCSIEGNRGIVEFKDFKCYVTTTINSEYIISEARLNKHQLTSSVVKFKSTKQSEQRALLKSKLLEGFGKDFYLEKTAFEIPIITNSKEIFNVSLSHHGNYGAYVIA